MGFAATGGSLWSCHTSGVLLKKKGTEPAILLASGAPRLGPFFVNNTVLYSIRVYTVAFIDLLISMYINTLNCNTLHTQLPTRSKKSFFFQQVLDQTSFCLAKHATTHRLGITARISSILLVPAVAWLADLQGAAWILFLGASMLTLLGLPLYLSMTVPRRGQKNIGVLVRSVGFGSPTNKKGQKDPKGFIFFLHQSCFHN